MILPVAADTKVSARTKSKALTLSQTASPLSPSQKVIPKINSSRKRGSIDFKILSIFNKRKT